MKAANVVMRRGDAEAAAVLVRCVRDPHDPRLPAEVGSLVQAGKLSAFLSLAHLHRVLSAVAPALRGAPGVPEDERRDVESHVAEQAARHLRILEDLRLAGEALDAEGIPWAVIKGPALAETVYPSSEQRTYGDLDIVVPAMRFADAVHALEHAGSAIEDQNWALLRRERRSQLHMRLPLGTLGDVHWHLVNRGVVRDGFSVQMDEIFSRIHRVSGSVGELSVLDPTDALLHLGLHAALSGSNRLLWMRDVSLTAGHGDIDFEALRQRARSWRIGPSTAITFDRAVATLGAPIDARTIEALYGSTVRKSVSRWLNARWPVERSIGQDPASLWAQLVRSSGGASIVATAQRANRALRERGASLDGHASLMPLGSERDRDTFFASIGSGPEMR